MSAKIYKTNIQRGGGIDGFEFREWTCILYDQERQRKMESHPYFLDGRIWVFGQEPKSKEPEPVVIEKPTVLDKLFSEDELKQISAKLSGEEIVEMVRVLLAAKPVQTGEIEPNYSRMTKNEIMNELRKREITFPESATRQVLISLLMEKISEEQ